MQETSKKVKLTHEQYFALEEKSDIRQEYYQGEIYDLAGGSVNHARIVRNFAHFSFDQLIEKSCEIFTSEMKVHIEAVDLFTYPDILIIYGQPQFYKKRDDVVLNPVLIAEVLSESTKSYDRGDKFYFYRQIPTLKHYLIIDQYSLHIEYFQLGQDGHWILSEFSDLNEPLKIRQPDFSLTLKDIYRGVTFSEEKGKAEKAGR